MRRSPSEFFAHLLTLKVIKLEKENPLLTLDLVSRAAACKEPHAFLLLAGYHDEIQSEIQLLDTQSVFTSRRPDCVLRFSYQDEVYLFVAEFQRKSDADMSLRMMQNLCAVSIEAEQRGDKDVIVDLIEFRMKENARVLKTDIFRVSSPISSIEEKLSWRSINAFADNIKYTMLDPERFPVTFALWIGHSFEALQLHVEYIEKREDSAQKSLTHSHVDRLDQSS